MCKTGLAEEAASHDLWQEAVCLSVKVVDGLMEVTVALGEGFVMLVGLNSGSQDTRKDGVSEQAAAPGGR